MILNDVYENTNVILDRFQFCSNNSKFTEIILLFLFGNNINNQQLGVERYGIVSVIISIIDK